MKARPLYILSIIFVASFVGRIAVMASEINGSSTSDKAQPSGAPEKKTAAKPCMTGELADVLTARLEKLEAEETEFAARKTELARYEAQIETRLLDLKNANALLAEKLERKQTDHNARIAKVAAIYEGMKPSQASEIIEKMDPEFAAGLLAAIASEQAAQIVAAMDPQKAYLVSVIIANTANNAQYPAAN